MERPPAGPLLFRREQWRGVTNHWRGLGLLGGVTASELALRLDSLSVFWGLSGCWGLLACWGLLGTWAE